MDNNTKKIKSRKELKSRFDEVTTSDKKGKLKPTYKLADYDRFEDIISNSPKKSLRKDLIKYNQACYKRNRKQYLIVQLLGLILIMISAGYIWFADLKTINQIMTPLLTSGLSLLYLVMDVLAYRRKNRMIVQVEELFKKIV